jgi:hypothetical protein
VQGENIGAASGDRKGRPSTSRGRSIAAPSVAQTHWPVTSSYVIPTDESIKQMKKDLATHVADN